MACEAAESATLFRQVPWAVQPCPALRLFQLSSGFVFFVRKCLPQLSLPCIRAEAGVPVHAAMQDYSGSTCFRASQDVVAIVFAGHGGATTP